MNLKSDKSRQNNPLSEMNNLLRLRFQLAKPVNASIFRPMLIYRPIYSQPSLQSKIMQPMRQISTTPKLNAPFLTKIPVHDSVAVTMSITIPLVATGMYFMYSGLLIASLFGFIFLYCLGSVALLSALSPVIGILNYLIAWK
ncbi:hypothetical protein HDV04_002707 [Boothiomyces sp. JEL0838]|nr:hypothetical protein HDV04_002707 [Boothiomyces sp. JEL0838]